MASTSEKEDHCLHARVTDLLRLSDKIGAPRFLGFLDERERALCTSWCGKERDRVLFWGGHDEAERTMLGVFPPDYPPDAAYFPMTAIAFAYRRETALTHRDFLGTLLSFGIKRSSVGDILCGEGLSVVFVCDEIAPFLMQEVTRVGGEGVTLTRDYTGDLPQTARFRELSDTVASARLDAVVAALCRLSRGAAAEAIKSGRVTRNFLPCESVSAVVATGDTLSVRGVGKFRIVSVDALTRKGRLVLKAQQYL